MAEATVVPEILCIVGRLMAIAPLVPRVIADLAAIAQALRGSSDPAARACADALHNPERIKTANPHL